MHDGYRFKINKFVIYENKKLDRKKNTKLHRNHQVVYIIIFLKLMYNNNFKA